MFRGGYGCWGLRQLDPPSQSRVRPPWRTDDMVIVPNENSDIQSLSSLSPHCQPPLEHGQWNRCAIEALEDAPGNYLRGPFRFLNPVVKRLFWLAFWVDVCICFWEPPPKRIFSDVADKTEFMKHPVSRYEPTVPGVNTPWDFTNRWFNTS